MIIKLPKVLILSISSWQEINGIGNTLSNFYGNWPTNSIANIFCRNQTPQNAVCNKYYLIDEIELAKAIVRRKEVGREYIVDIEPPAKQITAEQTQPRQEKLLHFARSYCSSLLVVVRESIWKLGKWRNENLRQFLSDFSPDIIVMHITDAFFTHDITKFCRELTRARIVLFFLDDNVSFKQLSFSPIFWIRRFLLRAKVRKTVEISAKRYGASKDLCEEYSKIFKCDFEPLYKGASFDNYVNKTNVNKPIRIIYAGNLFYGRWKTLRTLIEELKKINDKSKTFELHIYSHNKLSEKMKRALSVEGTSFVMKGVSYSELKEILSESDIVLHVESFSLKQKLVTRLSFSTKIIDCFQSARCILAIGPGDISSIKYLKESNAALVVDRKEDIAKTLKSIEEKPDLIIDYSQRAFLFGKENHSIDKVREKIEHDFVELVRRNLKL